MSALGNARSGALFPGQGSQVLGMRELVVERCPELFERCCELVGEDPFPRVDESTQFAQPAIFCASIAHWQGLEMRPTAAAGHSLGEIAALAAAGVIAVNSALRAVVTRGRLMAEADPNGTMLALIGTDEATAQEFASDAHLTVANDNAPGQIVLSGDRELVKTARTLAKEKGLRAIALNVAGAFHSPSMESAVAPFRAALTDIELHEPRFPVFSCATTAPFTNIKDELAQALVRPVLWRQTVTELYSTGITNFVDVGPGKILSGMVKRIVPEAQVTTTEVQLSHA